MVYFKILATNSDPILVRPCLVLIIMQQRYHFFQVLIYVMVNRFTASTITNETKQKKERFCG